MKAQYVSAHFLLPELITPFAKGKYAGVLRPLWGMHLAQAGIYVPPEPLILMGVKATVYTRHDVELRLCHRKAVLWQTKMPPHHEIVSHFWVMQLPLMRGNHYFVWAKARGKRELPKITVQMYAQRGEDYAKSKQ